MLKHYLLAGIDELCVHVHLAKSDDPLLERTLRVTESIGCEIASVSVGSWQEFELSVWLGAMRRHPDDWWVLADQDELHVYPDDLRRLLSFCDQRGFQCIRGAFVDRISSDGGFPSVDITTPLWPQFSLGGLLSPTILGASPMKIVAAKGTVTITPGHHGAVAAVPCPIRDVFVQVHHFKWTAGVIARLQDRFATLRHRNVALWEQSARFVHYCETHNSRIDINDRRLLLAPCTPDYPYWDLITASLIAKRDRSHRLFT